jgi:hypothetical protein
MAWRWNALLFAAASALFFLLPMAHRQKSELLQWLIAALSQGEHPRSCNFHQLLIVDSFQCAP